jgi:HAD superfamily hydrolase (TIGR01509 family)
MNKTTQDIAWVVFDLGGIVVPESGTLIDNEMSAYLTLSPHQLSIFTSKFSQGLTTGKVSLLDMYSEILREWRLPFLPDDILKHHLAYYRQVSTQHNAKVVRLIETLKDYFGVACLTNTEKEIAGICRETGLYDYFHRVFLSIDLGMQKPDREIYDKVVDNLGCSSESIIFIDDKVENVQAAIEIGMIGFLFNTAEELRIALSDFCPSLLNKEVE